MRPSLPQSRCFVLLHPRGDGIVWVDANGDNVNLLLIVILVIVGYGAIVVVGHGSTCLVGGAMVGETRRRNLGAG